MSEPTKRIKLSGNMITVDMESMETESEIIERLTQELAESKSTIKRLEAEKALLSESHLAQENKRLVAEMLELRNAIQRDTDAFIRLTRERDEAIKARDHNRVCIERLARERDELRAWKESAMAVEREWDPNAIATALGGWPGESQRAVIAREVPKLLARVKRLEEEQAKERKERESLRRGHPDLEGKLVPCPFCGESEHLNGQAAVYGKWIRCMRCLASGPVEPTVQEVRDAWNLSKAKEAKT